MLTSWLSELDLDPHGRRALAVGCGLGEDAELLSRLGFATTAFDVLPAAVRASRQRFPASTVHYRVADLLDPPAGWHRGLDLVVESMTVQSMPVSVRTTAIAHVRDLAATGRTLLVIAFARLDTEPGQGPPWGLSRDERESFAQDGLQAVDVEGPQQTPDMLRWRAQFRRSPQVGEQSAQDRRADPVPLPQPSAPGSSPVQHITFSVRFDQAPGRYKIVHRVQVDPCPCQLPSNTNRTGALR